VIRYEKYRKSPGGLARAVCDEPGCGATAPAHVADGAGAWTSAFAQADAGREGWQIRYKPLSPGRLLQQVFCPAHVRPRCGTCLKLEADCRCRCTICSLGECSCPGGKSRTRPGHS
jgi:hypothetical protein